MNTNLPRQFRSPPSAQRGVVLAVVLILLVVMSLIGLASLRGTLMEERMSSNMRDRSLSFSAAETALREAEALAITKPTVPTTPGACNLGLCGTPDPNATQPVWLDPTVWAAAPNATVASGTPAAQYIIELLAKDVPPPGSCVATKDVPGAICTGTGYRYRITARSAATGRAEVTLQTTYAVQ